MRQSNLYLVIYAAALTAICGALLAFTSESLKPKQKANQEIERKTIILKTAGLDLAQWSDVQKLYEERVKSYVVNHKGEVVDGINAETVEVAKEFKKPVEERLLPVYEVSDDQGKIVAYVLPMYGNGLWDAIWGYIALAPDMNTIVGVNFDHKSETPGLGARITTEEVQKRFVGKKIFNEKGEIVGVEMQKGEVGNEAYANDPHKVDGMSGATLTGKGVNQMIYDYMKAYETFLRSKRTTQNA